MQNLDKNVLFEILKNLDSKSVINACSVNKRFFQLCQNPVIFKRLMELHYPQIPINKDPKKQYTEIANGIITKYKGVINEYYELDHFIPGRGGVILNIIGKLDPGTKVWTACRMEYSDGPINIYGQCMAFKNKEDALEYAFNLFTKNTEIFIKEGFISSLKVTQGTKEEIKRLLENHYLDAPHYIYQDYFTGNDVDVYYQVFETVLP